MQSIKILTQLLGALRGKAQRKEDKRSLWGSQMRVQSPCPLAGSVAGVPETKETQLQVPIFLCPEAEPTTPSSSCGQMMPW